MHSRTIFRVSAVLHVRESNKCCIRVFGFISKAKVASDPSRVVILINLPTNCILALLLRLPRSFRIPCGHDLVHLRRLNWTIRLSACQFSLFSILCLNLLAFALVTPRRQKKLFYPHALSPTSTCLSLFLHVFVFVLLAQPSQHLGFSHGLLRCRPVSLYSDHHSIFSQFVH